ASLTTPLYDSSSNAWSARFLKIFGVADILVFAPRFIQWLLGYVPYTSISKGHVLMEELDKFIIKEILTTPLTKIEDTKGNFVRSYIKKVEESKEDTNSNFEYRHLVGNVKGFIGAGILGATASVLFNLANFAAHPDTLQAASAARDRRRARSGQGTHMGGSKTNAFYIRLRRRSGTVQGISASRSSKIIDSYHFYLFIVESPYYGKCPIVVRKREDADTCYYLATIFAP
ncbi:hypothetical protein MTO96_034001, partial [Rhipicephalus appendiculatus]